MKESTIKRNILRYLKTIPNSKWEVSPPGSRSGRADLSGCIRGHRVEIEVKNETGRLSKLQRYEINEWLRAGATAFVARSVEDVRLHLG